MGPYEYWRRGRKKPDYNSHDGISRVYDLVSFPELAFFSFLPCRVVPHVDHSGETYAHLTESGWTKNT